MHPGGVCRDRADDRPAARYEDEAEARTEKEPSAEVAIRAAAAEARQGTLDPDADLREDQAGRDEEQQPDREVAQEVLWQVQLAQQPGGDQREDGEARDEPGDDRVRPPAAAARAPREQDRQHRKHTRRDRGHDPRREGDREQDQEAPVHALSVQSRVDARRYASAAGAVFRSGLSAAGFGPFCDCFCWDWPCAWPFFLRLRRLRRERLPAAFGAGRLSASALATSWIVPSRSRAASISWFARGV